MTRNGTSKVQPVKGPHNQHDTSPAVEGGLVEVDDGSDRQGRASQLEGTSGSSTRTGEWDGGSPSPSARDHSRGGHRSGVPHDLAKAALKAFESGDPTQAFQATSDLIEAYRAQSAELAQLRFKVNFGSPICENCDGLRAGPGVIATCYQVKRCDYTNVRGDVINPTQRQVIASLLGEGDLKLQMG